MEQGQIETNKDLSKTKLKATLAIENWAWDRLIRANKHRRLTQHCAACASGIGP
jgi:hypothetical protein